MTTTIHIGNPCKPGVACRDNYQTVAHNPVLIVNAISFGRDNADAEAGVRYITAGMPGLGRAIMRAAQPESVTLTSDGRGYIPTWHDGADDGAEWVYVERWSAAGCEFHGFIHPVSRKILQVG